MGTSSNEPVRSTGSDVQSEFLPQLNVDIRISKGRARVIIKAGGHLSRTGAKTSHRTFYYFVGIPDGAVAARGPVGIAADVLAACYATYYQDLSAAASESEPAFHLQEPGAQWSEPELPLE